MTLPLEPEAVTLVDARADSCSVGLTESGWQLYLLECINGSVYTGIARDAQKRFNEHCTGKGARYTRMHRPSRLLAVFAYPDRASASRAEVLIKQLLPAQKRALCMAQDPPFAITPECAEPDPDKSCPDL